MAESDQGHTPHQSHGLHTVADLNWFGRLRLALRRQSRRMYRKIGHPKHRRRGGLRGWLAARVNNRNLWQAARQPVANGLAVGLFFAMLPLPLQGLFAAVFSIARGWNVPASIVATWVSNPLTYPLMAAASKGCIVFASGAVGAQASLSGVSLKELGGCIFTADWTGLKAIAAKAGWGVLPEFLLGLAITGMLCAVAGWLLVHALWPLFRRREPAPATPA